MKRKLVILFFCLALSFCSKQKKEEQKELSQESIDKTATSIQAQLDEFEPSIKIYKITRLDIPTFLTIYISFLEDQIVWLRDNYRKGTNNNINNESDENLSLDSQKFLVEQAQQKEDFFKKWGIAFNDFDQFSLTHSQEVQDYLRSQSVEQTKIEKLEQFLSAIQTSNPMQNDEYNFKEENLIVEKATEQEENILSNKKTKNDITIPYDNTDNNEEGEF